MRAVPCIAAAALAGSAAGGVCPPRWWSAGTGLGPAGIARAMLAADIEGATRLYIGGEFDSAGGAAARNIASWDGSTWRQPGTGLSGPAVSMTIHRFAGGPRLFIGGFFDEGDAAGPGPSGLVWLNGDAWGGTPGGSPLFWTMGLCSFEGGLFASAGVVDYVWKLDGPAWSVSGGGLESVIHAGLTHDDGSGPSLFVAGSMVEGVRRWDGAAWRSVGGGLNGAGYALAVFDDGSGARLYAGGRFSSPGRNLASWDGVSWRPLAGGVAGEVRALAVFDADGEGGAAARLAVGGELTEAGGSAANGLAFYGPCRADFTCDGLADFTDYLEFLNAFDAADASADLTGDGLVDFADYLDFLNAYAAGC